MSNVHAFRVYAAVCTSVLATACSIGPIGDPYGFTMNDNSKRPIVGKVLTDFRKVDVYAQNALTLLPEQAVGMRSRTVTDGLMSMEVVLEPSSELTFSVRSTPWADSVQQLDHIRIRVATSDRGENNVWVWLPIQQQWLRKTADIQPGKPFKVDIMSDALWTDVTVACTTFDKLHVQRPMTEWLTVRTGKESTARIIDPVFTPLIELEE